MFIDLKTQQKIKELREKEKPFGCMGCLGRVDDGLHEYDEKNDIWYCPTLDEE